MDRLMAIVCVSFSFFTPARGNAQRFKAFAGISYGIYDPDVRTKHIGWNASIEGKVHRFVGLVADVSSHYGTVTGIFDEKRCLVLIASAPLSDCEEKVKVSLYTFTAGPRVSVPLGRFRPYAHALFGAALFHEVTSLGPFTSSDFADEFGGGIDISINPDIAWRVQAEDFQILRGGVPFCVAGICPPSGDSLRVSTGLVFRF